MTAPHRKPREYAAPGVTVRWDQVRCIHAAECVRGLPEVFDPDRRPWIDPERATPDAVAEVVTRCPTGALTYERGDGGPAEAPPQDTTVTMAVDGPLYVRGDVRVVASNGSEVFAGPRVALCRCGASNHKPFCDGSHHEAGFTDPARLVREPAAEDGPGGPVTITLAANGPLLVSGRYTLQPAAGARGVPATKGALCRCGGSSTKPLCDGTHKTVGFEG